MKPDKLNFISPDWPVPSHIKAVCTTRYGGISQPPWDNFNLAEHVGDKPEHVSANREKLKNSLNLPTEPFWLEQTHSTLVSRFDVIQADAIYTDQPDKVCTVMTADCLPVLFSDKAGKRIAAAHAGWRGLAAGVLENTVACFPFPDQIVAWLGPAIGPQAFEVDEKVRDAFIAYQPEAEQAFYATSAGHWQADLYQLARLRLTAIGVTQITGGGFCTYSEPGRFYSYRRNQATGRMASLIWYTQIF